jgi:hypothetical protein
MNDGRLLFTSTRLRLNGKQGILKPESDGSYIMPIGGFNCLNSKGEVYTMENIKEIFESSSELMRKIQNGKCTGEWGHPEPRAGEDMRDFMNRACMVSDKDTCALFKEVWLDDKIARSAAMASYNIAPDTVVTMGRVKPHGLQWEALQRAFDDPDFNVSFSVLNQSRVLSMNFSFMMFHPTDADGKVPYLLLVPKRLDPSRRTVAWNIYFSS